MQKEIKIFKAEVKEFDEKDLTVVHFISTEKVDRTNDILYSSGMKIQGKPVVLFMHGRGDVGSEPIAKAVWIKRGEFKNNKGIQAKTQFYPDALGQRLWKKTTEGYMPNWSVGWIPLRDEYKTDKTGQRIRHVYEWELLEYSIIGVPAQPDAQTLAFKIMPEGALHRLAEGMRVNVMPEGGRLAEGMRVNVPFQKAERFEAMSIHIPNDFIPRMNEMARKKTRDYINKLKGRIT
jgi:hypothetical protein